MFFPRTLAVRLFSALLIVATFAAGHQHRLLVPPTDTLSIDRAKPAVATTAEAVDCAVCRAIESAEAVAPLTSAPLPVADAYDTLTGESAPEDDGATPHSPRGPPASRA